MNMPSRLKRRKNPKGTRLKRLNAYECPAHPNSKYKLVECEWCNWQWCPLCGMQCPICRHRIAVHPVLGRLPRKQWRWEYFSRLDHGNGKRNQK